MYPRVKVKEVEDDDQDYRHVVDDFSSKVKVHENVSPPSIAKVPKSYIANITIPSVSVAEERSNERYDNGNDNKQNIRASSIPPPRAVISSPDNDVMIGKNNRVKTVRRSVLKHHNLVESRHERCKVIPTKITENSIDRKKPKEASDESNAKGRRGSVVTAKSPIRHIKSGKTSSLNI